MVGKGENAGKQHFLPFPPCFLPFLKQALFFHSTLFCCLENAFNMDLSKIWSFGRVNSSFYIDSMAHNQYVALIVKMVVHTCTCPNYILFCLFILTLSSIYTHFNTLKKTTLGKYCGKR